MLKQFFTKLLSVSLSNKKAKKIALGTSISLLLTSIVPSASAYVDGMYIGGGVNYTWFAYDYRAKDINLESKEAAYFEQNDALGNKAGGQVLLGYTWLLPNNKYFVSVEGFGDFYSVQAKQEWNFNSVGREYSPSLEATIRNAYGLVVKPGVSINEKIAFFVQAGIAYSQLKDIVYNVGYAGGPGKEASQFAKLDNQNLFGYRIGLGAQYTLTENLVTELSWALTYYDNFEENVANNISPTGAVLGQLDAKFDAIRTNQVFLNLNYYFN